MKKILVLNLDDGEENEAINFLGQDIQIRQLGCHGDPEKARQCIENKDGQYDVIGLEGLPAALQLGPARKLHPTGQALRMLSRHTPLVDGSGVQQGIERWGIVLANRAQPGIFSQKKILLVPGRMLHFGVFSRVLTGGNGTLYRAFLLGGRAGW
jgi:hypothetical protein